MSKASVRPLENYSEFHACERIQQTVWGTLGVGAEVLSVTQKYGGAVLGAFLGGRMVGFLYAFLARRNGRLIHWSHMMAVEPPFRDLGLGFKLKLAHRRLALRQGIAAIAWTYDPLQSRNATLNIRRLGARVGEYVPNCYGQFQSAIERGLQSDRFVVSWPIRSTSVERRLRARRPDAPDLTLPVVNQTRMIARGFLENRDIALDLRAPGLLVEIPPNTDQMRTRALALARRWRAETRKIFQRYFSAGYRVEDFFPPTPAGGSRCFYLLRRISG